MKRIAATLVLAIFVVCAMAAVVRASTEDEAKAMVEKAVAYWKTHGREKAVTEFNNPKGQFVKDDLYINSNDFDGINLANGASPAMAGSNHLQLKDMNGKYFIQEMIEIAKTKGSGWVEYTWTNPLTKKTQTKATYVKKVEGANVFIGCGVFK